MLSARHRGGTKVDILITVVCILGLIAIIKLTTSRVTVTHRMTRDGTQIRGIHQSWVIFSREFNGIYPTPGLMARLTFNGLEVPGRGSEDISQNTTANLFSGCIMGNHFSADMCVGPTEPSGNVSVFDYEVYNYKAYNPANGVYWDTNFKADLHKLSHVSYAHMPIAGEMKAKHWRDTMDATIPIIGNRGPLGGEPDPKSITNKIHSPYDRWSGYIVSGDNHLTVGEGNFPKRPRENGQGYIIAPECLPAGKLLPETDAAITFTKEMIPTIGPIVQHD